MADKPSKGLADIIAASTALSDIDGRAGLLFYRGYDIHQLAGSATFEEIAYLLQRGRPPTRGELASYADEIAAGRALGSLVTACLPDVAGRQSPMEAMRSLVSLAGADDPDKDSNAAGASIRKAARLVAQQPLFVASYHAARNGGKVCTAEPELGLAANFLLQMRGAPPAPREAEIFDTCLVLHADHTMNASTFAARVCAATLSDMHSAVVAAIGTLKGPLHGGANEQVMYTLMDIRKSASDDPVDMVERAVRDRLARGEKIMGFGHRVYKMEDPPRHPSPPDVGGTRPGERRRHLLPDVPADGGERPGGKGPLPQRGFLRRHRLPLPSDPHRPVHPPVLCEPDGRLDGPHHGAACRQQAHPAGQRIHRRARAQLDTAGRAVRAAKGGQAA
jgi:citrate synthase